MKHPLIEEAEKVYFESFDAYYAGKAEGIKAGLLAGYKEELEYLIMIEFDLHHAYELSFNFCNELKDEQLQTEVNINTYIADQLNTHRDRIKKLKEKIKDLEAQE